MTVRWTVRAAEDRARSSRENRVLDGPPSLTKIEPRKRIGFRFVFYEICPRRYCRGFFFVRIGALWFVAVTALCRERLLTGAGSVIGCSAKRQQESPSGLDVLALLCLSHHTPERLVSRVPWNKSSAFTVIQAFEVLSF